MNVQAWCARQAVLDVLSTVCGATVEEIAKEADMKPAEVERTLTKLQSVGRVERWAGGWQIRQRN